MKFDIDGEEIERWPMGFRRKQTRRWCKGHPGVEHQWKRTKWISFYWIVYWIEKCKVCGRHGKFIETTRKKIF